MSNGDLEILDKNQKEKEDLSKLLSKDLMSLFENRPLFKFNFYSRIERGFINMDNFHITNHISTLSKIFNLAILDINNIQDLIKEAILQFIIC